ncbi:MAG: flavodoxin [Bacillota bacterium]|nr:flavodoxin [Bacillota bacterium]
MKKVAVIYWSNGGNVEVLADAIYNGAKENGSEVIIKQVSEARIDDVVNADAVAFGSPSMDNNRIEQQEMEPFIKQFKLLPNGGKPVVLFGSFGWDEGKFIESWKSTMQDYGFNVIGQIAVKEAPDQDEIHKAKDLGKLLAK